MLRVQRTQWAADDILINKCMTQHYGCTIEPTIAYNLSSRLIIQQLWGPTECANFCGYPRRIHENV